MTIQQITILISTGMKERGLSMCKLAKDTGISKGQLSKILSGKSSNPSYKNVVTLLKYFGVKKIIL